MDTATPGRDDNSGFDPVYRIELLYTSAPPLDAETLGAALSDRLGAVAQHDAEVPGDIRFVPVDKNRDLAGDNEPADLTFRAGAEPDHDRVGAALDQSFDVQDAEARLAACRAVLSMTVTAGPEFSDRARRTMISAGLLSLLDCTDPELVFWPASGQLLDPAKVRAKHAEPAHRANPTYGFVNVRLFNVQEGGTQIMDTLGLGALGLTDLQVHFKGLDKAEVADLLYSIAAYLMEEGDVIDNGHTVPGLLPGESWTCMHKIALVDPDRLVLDIDPGAAFAAGGDG